MSYPQDQPWAPFPVQDWSSLPADPLRAPAVDPGWAPPTDPRRWWVPLVVIATLGALLAGSVYVGTTTGSRPGSHAALDYLPADGAASFERTETTRELRTDVGSAVTESAQFLGVTGLLSTDSAVTLRVLPQIFEERTTVHVWRTTTTAAGGSPAAQTTRLYRTNSAVELLAVSTPTEAYAYTPALVELPASVAAGQRWSSAGSAGDQLDYRSELSAAPGPAGCLQVDGTIDYRSKQGGRVRVVSVERTWCTGRGVSAATESFADITTAARSIDALVPPHPDTAQPAIRWSAPQRWAERPFETVSEDATWGPGPMGGSPSVMPPVRTASGLTVRTVGSVNDLIAFAPSTSTEWTTRWRVHPGGTILTLSVFGDVIMVTTSARRLVAYSDHGVRLWERGLDELAPTSPVRISDQIAVLVDLSGAVTSLDIATGSLVWQHRVSFDVNVAPAVGAGLVVVMDRGGTTTALDATTGRPRWTQLLEGKSAAVLGDTVVVLQDQTAHALSAADGRHRWLRPFAGTFRRLVTTGDRLLLASKVTTVLIDERGVVTDRLSAYLEVSVVADYVLGWGTDTAELVDRDGQVVSRWPLPPLTASLEDRPVVILPQGVLLFGLEWTFRGWGREF